MQSIVKQWLINLFLSFASVLAGKGLRQEKVKGNQGKLRDSYYLCKKYIWESLFIPCFF